MYCNLIEHFLLHLKIAEWIDKEKPDKYSPTKGLGCFGDMAQLVHDMATGYEFKDPYAKRVAKEMRPHLSWIEEIYRSAETYGAVSWERVMGY